MEVRFDDEAGFKRQLRTAVEDALLDHGLVRSSAPRGRSAPDETEIDPGSTSTLSDADGGDSEEAGPRAAAESTSTSSDSTSASSSAGSHQSESLESTGTDAQTDNPDSGTNGTQSESTDPPTDRTRTDSTLGSGDSTARSESARASESTTTTDTTHQQSDARSARGGSTGEPTDTADSGATAPASKFTGPHDQETLSGDVATAEPSYDSLPRLRVLGQLHGTYIVAETDDGLVLIDQHAADERVNYERLQEAFAGDTTAQSLAQPVEIELTAGESALFDAYQEALASLGFYANREGRTVSVTTVPTVLDETLAPERLRDVLSSVIDADESAGEQAVESVADGFIADLACYPSITGNTSLQEGSVMDLLERLDDCENPYACPHGRPVVIEIDGEELEDRFERDYPGHSG
jgi:DNA mismatch repair protein MutL